MAPSSIPWILLGLMCLCSAMDIEGSKMAQWKFARHSRSTGLKKLFHKRQVPGSCGGNFTALHGMIRSPNYADYQTGQLSCTWHIKGSSCSKIEMEFVEFDSLDSDEESCQDFVMVKSGIGNVLEVFCGNSPPTTVVSNDGEMYVEMNSDPSIDYQAFTAYYNVIEVENDQDPVTDCGGILTAPEGTIKSPNYPSEYPNGATCVWQIEAPPGFTIILSANAFELGDDFNEDTCNTNKLVIEDNDETLGTFCGKTLPFDTLQSNSNNLNLRFHSDHCARYSGFSITYELARPNICGPSILTDTSGNITPPSNFGNYENNLNCQWRIQGPPNSNIILNFDYFHTEGGAGDCYDQLTISTEAEPVFALCGEAEPDSPIIVHNNVAIVTFTSDSAISYRGFNIRYEIIT